MAINRSILQLIGIGWGVNASMPINYLKGYALCRRPLLAPRGCHLRGLVRLFWHAGDHFGTSGALRKAMGAAGWTRGGTEQDDGKHSLE